MSSQSSGSASSKAHEPSMEDILASIRRMISDDDEPQAEMNEAMAPEIKAPPRASSLVRSIDEIPTDTPPVNPIRNVGAPSVPTPLAIDVSTVPEPDFTFEAFDADLDFENDLVIPDAAETISEEGLLDIDELIAAVESRVDENVKAATIDVAASDFNVQGERAASDNTDIELVKSLMADLTDDAAEEDHSDEPSDAELSQILDELSDIQVNDELAVEVDIEDSSDEDLNPLLQIAQEVKAEANAFALGTGAAAIAGDTVQAREEDSEIIEDFSEDIENEFEEAFEEAEDIQEIEETAETDASEHIIEQDTKQERQPMTDAAEETIIGSDIEEATTSAFASLASVVERKDEVVSSGPAIGDLVKEALQPMLKEWLDKNLKGIVERSVAKEIKRIANTK